MNEGAPYAKVYGADLEDPRVFDAAHQLARSSGVSEEWAHLVVVGLLASIDLWLLARGRQGEAGELPDDGFAVARSAAGLPPSAARNGLAALLAGRLLVKRGGTTYRVAFAGVYADRIGGRNKAREWRRARREERAGADPGGTVPHAYGTRTVRDPDANGTAPVSKTGRRAVAVAVDHLAQRPVVDPDFPSTTGRRATGAAAATAPGRSGGSAAACGEPVDCGRCEDGLLRRRGRKPVCCSCRRGRDRALRIKKAVVLENAQGAKARRSCGPDRGAEPMADIVARIAGRLKPDHGTTP